MSYLKDREIWLSNVPTGNPPAGYFWKFIQNGKVVVRDSSGNDQIMVATSGSQAITGSLTVTGGITGTATTASYVEYSNVANKPALVSGSEQITYSGLTGIPSGIVSGSAQIASFGIFATTGSNGFNGNQSITGSLTVTGQVVAQTLNVQQVTSSIVYSSGSNVFGNSLSNTQQFTGSVGVTGSLAVAGAGTFSSKVGVGGASATYPLTAYNASNGTTAAFGGTARGIRIDNDGTFSSGRSTIYGVDNTFYGSYQPLAIGGSELYFSISGTDKLTISSTGAATFSSSNLTLQSSSEAEVRSLSTSTGNYANFIVDTDNTVNYRLQMVGFGTTASGTLAGISRAGNGFVVKSGGLLAIGTRDSNALVLSTNEVERMRITSAGNVGIGTNGPSERLDILGPDGSGAAVRWRMDGGRKSGYLYSDSAGVAIYDTNLNDAGIYLAQNAQIDFRVSGSQRMIITSGGNVGIGTTSIAASSGYKMLRINGATTGAEIELAGNEVSYGYMYANAGVFVIDALASQPIVFRTGAQIRMTMNSSGNIYIGSASPGNEKLTIRQTTGNASALYVNTFGVTTGQSYGISIEAGTNASDRTFGAYSQAGTEYFRVRGDGLIFAPPIYNNTNSNAANVWVNSDGSLYRSTSSIKYKKNIENYTKGLAEVMQLRSVTYQGIHEVDGEKQFAGLIAEEVHDLGLTEFVQYAPDGSPDALSYQNMITLAIKAIQEQQTLIESLKSRIEILEQ